MMSVDASADIVVVGNGPVGQTTALLLAEWGLDVILIDRALGRMPIGSKATTQRPHSLDIWDIVGAGSEMVAEGIAKGASHVFYKDELLFTESYDDGSPKHYPPMLTISQARVEAILDEKIAASDRITVKWGNEWTQFAQDSDGVVVHCRDVNGVEHRYRSKYAVACVGSHAELVHNDLGLTFDGRRFDDKFLICDLKIANAPWKRDRYFHFDSRHNPGRQILIQPCPDDTFRVDWQLPREYDLEQDVESGGLDGRIRALVGDVPYELIWSSVYRFQARLASSFRVNRVFLAGDCAHLMSPFGGRGLTSGISDAENLAWKIAYVVKGWADDALLDTYDEERSAAAFENLTVTASTMDFLVPESDEQRARRIELLELARTQPTPATWSQIDTSRMAEPFWYPDSTLTTDDPTRPFPDEPPRGTVPRPGPGVLVPDIAVRVDDADVRLRELVRGHYTLLIEDAAVSRPEPLDATSPEVRSYAIDAIDASGRLREALGLRPGEIWIVRPDAYVAAVVESNDLTLAQHLADLTDMNHTLRGPRAPRAQWVDHGTGR